MAREGSFESKGPVVQRELGPFARIIDISGLKFGPFVRRKVVFEAELLWLRESQTTVVLKNAEQDRVIVTGSSYSDVYYGYLTSMGEPFEDAARMARTHAVTVDGPLIVEAILEVKDTPVVLNPTDRAVMGGTVYQHIPNDWMYDSPKVDSFVDAPMHDHQTWHEYMESFIKPREVLTLPIWSSRNGLKDTDNFQQLKATTEVALRGCDDRTIEIVRRRIANKAIWNE